jgi:glycyl-tRNA synthetase beta chain
MNNILAAFRRDNRDYRLTFVHADLAVKEELDLYDFFQKREGEISDKIGKSDYIGLFKLIIEGKGTIDAFFDKVLVMDKDIKIRDTRLGLIENILKNFSGLMDFTRIEDKKAGGN